ncbi:ATP-binding protein [Serratia ureilytica]
MCGKAGAGKSTLAQRLAQQPQTLLLVEDAWLATLYEQEMTSLQDYARCSDRLRRALGGTSFSCRAAAGPWRSISR